MSVRSDVRVPPAARTRTWLSLTPGYLLYCVISFFAIPFSLIRERRRRQKGLSGEGHRVRLAGGTAIPSASTVIVANGLGETRVGLVAYDQISPLSSSVALLVQKDPAFHFGVKSGRTVGYAPAHNPLSALRFLRRTKPAEIIFIESCSNYHLAFWARVAGIPTALVSVNLSETMAQRMRGNILGAWRVNLAKFVFAQSSGYASRLVDSGVWPEVVANGGLSLPDSLPSIGETEALGQKWRGILQLGPDQPVMLAGSTYEADEQLALAAFAKLDPALDAVLVVAPRQPNRELNLGPRSIRRSELDHGARNERNIVYLDSSGELGELYAVASVAHIGGTQSAKLGGHTPVEAMSFGVPITTGPEFGRHEPAMLSALSAGVAWVTLTPDELSQRWGEALTAPDLKAKTRSTLGQLMADNHTVFARLYSQIKGKRG